MTVDEAITRQVEQLLLYARNATPEDALMGVVMRKLLEINGMDKPTPAIEKELVLFAAAYRLAQRVAELEPSPQPPTPL